MNRPGRAAKAAPHMASPDPGGSPWVPPCCKRGLSSAGEIGSCASEGRCSYLSWAASWEQVTGIRGGRREGKNLKDFLAGAAVQRCRCSTRARAPLLARPTREQPLDSEIWGQPAGFGDGKAESLVPRAA